MIVLPDLRKNRVKTVKYAVNDTLTKSTLISSHKFISNVAKTLKTFQIKSIAFELIIEFFKCLVFERLYLIKCLVFNKNSENLMWPYV